MSEVVLNEPNLRLLLDTQEGPVGLFLTGIAEHATGRATNRAKQILKDSVLADMIVGFDVKEEPLRAEIGFTGEGSITRYLEAKEEREHWLSEAVLQGE